jgi:hypothetical protein
MCSSLHRLGSELQSAYLSTELGAPGASRRCEGLYWREPKASRFAWYV